MRNKKTIDEMSLFERGQLTAINEILGHIENDIAEIDSKKTPYLLRETAKDALYTYKMLIKRDLWAFMAKQINEYKKLITNEEE